MSLYFSTFNISFPPSLKKKFPIPFAISQIYRNQKSFVQRMQTCPMTPFRDAPKRHSDISEYLKHCGFKIIYENILGVLADCYPQIAF